MAAVPSWDLFITLFFIIGIAYGFMLQREKVVVTTIATYAAIVVTQIFGDTVQQFFQGDKTILGQIFIRANTTPFTIQIGLFVAVIALISAKAGLSGGKGKGMMSPLEIIGHSFLGTALILSTILSFMPIEEQQSIMAQSNLAAKLINMHNIWVILPIIGLIASGIIFKHNSSSSD